MEAGEREGRMPHGILLARRPWTLWSAKISKSAELFFDLLMVGGLRGVWAKSGEISVETEYPFGDNSRWRDCRFADVPSTSLWKHRLKVEGGAAE